MAIYEQDVVMFETKENGDKVIKMPVSRANNIEGIGRSANTAYVVGDVVYVDNNKKVALKCTQAGTTSSSELNVSTASIGNVITDGSVKWQVCNRTSDVTSVNGKTGDVVVDLPVGHMYWSVEPNVPAGRLPALGATYNRSLYADLWAWANSVGLVKTESEWQAIASANDGNCAYYSSGDGSTTFRVPKLPNALTADIADELAVKGNGLNLGFTDGQNNFALATGNASNMVVSGVPYYGQSIGTKWTGGGSYPAEYSLGITTDPAKSGIVAKTSATKITGQWLIVAFGVAHNIGEADIANVMSAVEQVQTSVGTLEQGVGTAIDYIIESYRNGAEWYEVYKSGKVRQGGIVTTVNTGNLANHTITFLYKMPHSYYHVSATQVDTGSAGIGSGNIGTKTREVTNMILQQAAMGGGYISWEVEG